jgi:hypothetical protein
MSSDPVQTVAQEQPEPLAAISAEVSAPAEAPAAVIDAPAAVDVAAAEAAIAGEPVVAGPGPAPTQAPTAIKSANPPASPGSPSPAKKLECARRSLQADLVNSISCIEDFGSAICAVSSGAKDVLGDIGFYLLKKILDKAVEISDTLMARTTLSPQAIKAAACTIVPPIITHEAMEDWKAAFEGAANPAAWNELFKAYEAKVDSMRAKNPEWAKDTKARSDFSKRKNDFARKSLNLLIRPTLTIRLARLIVPKHIRTGGINVGIALSYVLSAIFDMLGWAVIESNPKKAGNWRLSTRAIYNGISLSEPLRFVLGDLVVAGGPLGLLVNPSGSVSTASTAACKKKKAAAAKKKKMADLPDSEEDEGSDLDDISDEPSEDEEGEISDSDEEEEEEEVEKGPKKRKIAKISKAASKKKSKSKSGTSGKKQQPIAGRKRKSSGPIGRKGKAPAAKKAKN